MAQNKTTQTRDSVPAFVASIADETRRAEVRKLIALMKEATGEPPRMWGTSIVGFGRYAYKYESGREGEWFAAGLSPRKANLTLYVLPGLHEYADDLPKLGTFTTGKSCIYVKKLDDLHLPTLKRMVTRAGKLAGK
jgi:hypothetical protein